MGAQVCTDTGVAETKDTVKLNIYDLAGNRAIEEANKVFRTLGTGAFHAAVEVNGKEWSYGFNEQGSGVFTCAPHGCSAHKFRESINLGDTDLTESEIADVLEKMKEDWQGHDYDLLFKNCTHFSKALADQLHAKEVPKWVTSLAGAGATTFKGLTEACVKGGEACNEIQAKAIIAAAKAGKIDEQYQIRGKVQAKAHELLVKAGELEEKWELQKHAENVGAQITNLWQQATSPKKESPAK